jgi:uncharacterized phage protein gp47/JayE
MSGQLAIFDDTGLTIPTARQIIDQIAQDQRDTIDSGIVTDEVEPLGQVNGIVGNEFRRVYELIHALYSYFDPWSAEGIFLTNILTLSGYVRFKPKASTVVCLVDLDASTTLAAGSEAHVDGEPDNVWVLDTDVTSTTAGDYESNWTAKEVGEQRANAGTLTVIATPSPGWNSITNPLDAVVGNLEESDTSARTNREEQLQKAGGATPGGIASQVDAVDGVISVQLYENTSLFPDINGLPGKSFEVVVWDGSVPEAEDIAIAQAIWESRAGGIEPFGNTSGIATDSENVEHTMFFSRATQRNVWVEMDIDTDEDYGGNALLEQAIVTEARAVQIPGVDVIKALYSKVAMQQPGVTNVFQVRLGFAASPTLTADLEIGVRERAEFDTSRIEIFTP